jgi:hypothetical protein
VKYSLISENNIPNSLIQGFLALLSKLLAGIFEKAMLCMENLFNMQ